MTAVSPTPTYVGDLRDGLAEMLDTDPRALLLGQDVLDPYGGAFKATAGLSTRFPTKVLTTPISEAAVLGVGVGMAVRGFRPIIEVMFGDFTTLIVDQMVNYASKIPAMYQGVDMSLVVRTPMGGGRGYGPTHSQSLERLFLGIPTLRIVAPSHFHSPGRSLAAVTREFGGITLFVEHKLLYPERLVLETAGVVSRHVIGVPGLETVVVRNFSDGEPDVTVVCYGGSSLLLRDVLPKLAHEEIRVSAVLPALVQPLPIDHLISEARLTGRVVVVEEAPVSHGWGAEVAASISEHLWRDLRRPVARIGAANTIIPAGRELEQAVLPSPSDLATAIIGLLE